MKCFNCKKEIKQESEQIHIGDGDFVCGNECEKDFLAKRSSFFTHIGNDDWYESEFPELIKKEVKGLNREDLSK